MGLIQTTMLCSFPALQAKTKLQFTIEYRLLKNSEGNCDGEWNFLSKEGARHCLIMQVA